MNIGNIVTPNEKGQVVIPAKIRKQLGIDMSTALQVVASGSSVVMHPISGVVRRGDLTKEAFLKILEETRGAWGPETKEDKKRTARRRRIELAASRKRKQAW